MTMCKECGKREVRARGYCQACYYRLKRHGHFTIRPKETDDQRFDRMYKVNEATGCWIWTGWRHAFGYGGMTAHGQGNYRAHTFSYERFNGPVPKGMVIRHTCDRPACVNPAHLLIGTQGDNIKDCLDRGRIAREEKHSQAKLTNAQVAEIRSLASTMKQIEIAKMFDVDPSAISRILSRKRRPKS